MTAASSPDGSITVIFTPHNATGKYGDGQVATVVEDPTDAAEAAVERAIDALLGYPVPADWADPTAIALRRERLCAVASEAAGVVVELLVHHQLGTARGVALQVDEAPVIAASQAVEKLDWVLVRYHRDTRLRDGLEVIQGAMAAEAGPGVAAVVTRLLERLRRELTELMLASWSLSCHAGNQRTDDD